MMCVVVIAQLFQLLLKQPSEQPLCIRWNMGFAAVLIFFSLELKTVATKILNIPTVFYLDLKRKLFMEQLQIYDFRVQARNHEP